MKGIIDSALGRSRTVLATLLLILIAGTVSYIEIPKESDPDINIPIIYTRIMHDGISPEDAERLLLRPMEQELRSIEGVKEMSSTAFEGGATVTLEFEAGFDADKALDDVREKVDLANTDLPDDTDEPTVHEVNLSLFPVIVVILSGDVPERTLLRLARDLQDEIEGIPTVLEADIAGDRDEQTEVIIDPVKLESYGIAPTVAVSSIISNNKLVPAGAQDTGRGRFSIKVPGLLESVRDILDLPIVVNGDAVVTVGDIAEVRHGFKDPEGYARVGGQPALALEVSKRSGENVIDTIEQVRSVVETERANWPAELRNAVDVSFSQDKSGDIRIMLTDLQNNVIMAVLLVMIVVVAALGWRSAAFVGIAIPGSFLASILVLSGMGLTINIVVLFALILAVGMLVDGAIVVTEYADRKMAEGLHRRRAYGLAAKRMAWPIIASTATTLAAFLPLLFWPGVVGEFMKFLPITLLTTLTASLVMALIFVPTMGSLFGKAASAGSKTLDSLHEAEEGELTRLSGITGFYIRSLRFALRHPGKIVLVSVLMLVGAQVGYAKFGHGVEFFPDVEPENAIVEVRARGNLSVHEKDAIMRQVENRILDMTEFDSIYTRTRNAAGRNQAEDVIGNITLELKEWNERRSADDIMQDIRDRTADIAGVIIDTREQEQGPPTGKPIQLQLSARDASLLGPSVEKVHALFDRVGGLMNIEDSRPLPGIDWVLRVDRSQAAKFGADVNAIGKAVQLVTTGVLMDDYRPDGSDDEVEIRVRYPEQYRTVDQLDQIRIVTTKGPVPIGNFVKRSAEPSVGTINRVDGKRVMTVKADVLPGVQVDTKLKEIQAMLPSLGLDRSVGIEFKGENEEQQKAQAFLAKAFAVALFIMAIILVTQFNSFYSAFLILTAVIMSTIGVLIGLLVTNQPFGIVMTGVGVIALAGIVVNNNIVLIDTFDRLRKTASTPLEAILLTGAQRLRPVMLTTITTILGLMPMVLRTNIDFVTREVTFGAPSSQWWVQLATAVVFGLGFATVLTLVFTPCALMVRENVRARRERRGAGKAERNRESVADEAGEPQAAE